MFNHCPGQDSRNLKADLFNCPKCSRSVEIFSDETRIKCKLCKNWVYREKTPSCADWCTSARECFEQRFPQGGEKGE